MKTAFKILLVLVILVAPAIYFAAKYIQKARAPLEVTEQVEQELETFIREVVSLVKQEDVSALRDRMDIRDLVREFGRSTEYSSSSIRADNALANLFLESLTSWLSSEELDNVELVKINWLKRGRHAEVLVNFPYVDYSGDMSPELFSFEVRRDGSTYRLYDFGFHGYGASFCESMFVDEPLKVSRTRALGMYTRTMGMITEDQEVQLKILLEIDSAALPKAIQMEHRISIGMLQEDLGQHMVAAQSYEWVMERWPEQYGVAIPLARCHLMEGRYDLVESLMKTYIEKSERDVLALRMLGEARLEGGDLEGARDSFLKGLALSEHEESTMVRGCLDTVDPKDAAGMQQMFVDLGDGHPERASAIETWAIYHDDPAISGVFLEHARSSETNRAHLAFIEGRVYNNATNFAAAAVSFRTAYGHAIEAKDEDFADQVSAYLLWAVDESEGPLPALKQAPILEDAFLDLTDHYVWDEIDTNVWKELVAYVSEKDPEAAWVAEAKADWAEHHEEWAEAIALFRKVKSMANDEDKQNAELGIMRCRAHLGEAIPAYNGATNKVQAFRVIRWQLSNEALKAEFEAFLMATVGDTGVDESRPSSVNPDLFHDESDFTANELHQAWSDLRFFQGRYAESQKLAMAAENQDGEAWWVKRRVFMCLLEEEKYEEANAWLVEKELPVWNHLDLLVRQENVDGVVALILENREENEFDYMINYSDAVGRLKEPPFKAAMDKIGFPKLNPDYE